jgi:tetratricopeptide (TPR) repeat protein
VRKHHLGWAAVLLAAAAPVAGAADRCRLLMSTPLPVRMENLRPVISADIDGVPARFIIDTGSFFDFMAPAAAAQFKLPLRDAPPGFFVQGVGGSIIPQIATAKTFTVAGLTTRRALFLVGNNEFGGGEAGILGQNLLRIADVDYDFADGVLRFIRPQHCAGYVLAYWAKPNQAIGEVDLRWTSTQRPQLLGKAAVNGHDIAVLFDTGSARTILSLAAARRADITPASPGVILAGRTRGVGRHVIQVWSAPVALFEIGGEKIERTRLLIGDVNLPGLDVDMLLGSDFFLAHHIYVAYSQSKLYFTYNGGPVFDLNARRPAQPTGGEPSPAAGSMSNADGTAAASQPSAAPNGGAPSDAPTDAAGFMRRGMAEISRGELPAAIADLTRSCPLATADADCHYQRGLAYWRNHERQPALADFDDALKIAPGDYDAHLARAELQLPQLHDGVADDLDAVDRLAPAQADLRLQLASLYDLIDRYGTAAQQLDLWIEYHPLDNRLPAALGWRCWDRAAAGEKLQAALADCNRALHARLAASHSVFWRLTHHTPPGPEWLLSNRSLVYLRLGEPDKAIADDDAALAQIPPQTSEGRANLLYLRGLAELRKGLKAEASTDLAAARKLRPGIGKRYAGMGLTP